MISQQSTESHGNKKDLLAIDQRIKDMTPQIERYCHVSEQATEGKKCEDPGVLYKVMEYYAKELDKLQQQLDTIKTTSIFSINDEPDMSQLILGVDQQIEDKHERLKRQIELLNHVYKIKDENGMTASDRLEAEKKSMESMKAVRDTRTKIKKTISSSKDTLFKIGPMVAAGALATTAAALAYYNFTSK